MMRYSALLGERWFGGADVETAVEIARVGIDDFGVEMEPEFDAERGFADGGRSGDDDEFRFIGFWCQSSARFIIQLR